MFIVLDSAEFADSAQVHKARMVLETVWTTGKPWETLVSEGEFFG